MAITNVDTTKNIKKSVSKESVGIVNLIADMDGLAPHAGLLVLCKEDELLYFADGAGWNQVEVASESWEYALTIGQDINIYGKYTDGGVGALDPNHVGGIIVLDLQGNTTNDFVQLRMSGGGQLSGANQVRVSFEGTSPITLNWNTSFYTVTDAPTVAHLVAENGNTIGVNIETL